MIETCFVLVSWQYSFRSYRELYLLIIISIWCIRRLGAPFKVGSLGPLNLLHRACSCSKGAKRGGGEEVNFGTENILRISELDRTWFPKLNTRPLGNDQFKIVSLVPTLLATLRDHWVFFVLLEQKDFSTGWEQFLPPLNWNKTNLLSFCAAAYIRTHVVRTWDERAPWSIYITMNCSFIASAVRRQKLHTYVGEFRCQIKSGCRKLEGRGV